MNPDEIQKAIAAHTTWKSRLRTAIDAGRSDVTAEQVEPDNLCAFGKWLHGLPSSDRNSEHFKKVQPLHAAFHKEAANVLRLALSGKKPEASKCMASGGSYLTASTQLIIALTRWQESLAAKTR